LLKVEEFQGREVGDVLSAACLAHDIGNPPFGHAGEDAIQRFFASYSVPGLTERQKIDLESYEGNAQGFRILARLQFEDYGGMQLTLATLGAYMKYPRESGCDFDKTRTAAKKFGAFQSEIDLLSELATKLSLSTYLTSQGGRGWMRHPFAYLVEAADDICNSILDLEDACRLQWLSNSKFDDMLKEIAGAKFSASKYSSYRQPKDKTGYLRAISIGALVDESSQAFVTNVDNLLGGIDVVPLVEMTSHNGVLSQLKKLAVQECYQNPQVLEREAAGYAALSGLLTRFVPVVIGAAPSKGSLEHRLLQLLDQRADLKLASQSPYERVMRVLDYISGMTDSYAINSYRRLSGVQT
jgi:dGTPase